MHEVVNLLRLMGPCPLYLITAFSKRNGIGWSSRLNASQAPILCTFGQPVPGPSPFVERCTGGDGQVDSVAKVMVRPVSKPAHTCPQHPHNSPC